MILASLINSSLAKYFQSIKNLIDDIEKVITNMSIRSQVAEAANRATVALIAFTASLN